MSTQITPVAAIPPAASATESQTRVAVICDFAEENWPSMDLVGDMLHEHLRDYEMLAPRRIRPAMRSVGAPTGKSARLFGRFVTYPRLLRRLARNFDIFHIVDHSYAHLVHELPAHRTIVTCHDLDTFRCLLEPKLEPRSLAFRTMTRRILSGMQRAAHVTCDTAATRDSILRYRLLPPERLTVVHNGVHTSLSPLADRIADGEIARQLRREPQLCPELLHVGTTIRRKRIDVLLHVFAEVRRHNPDVRLLRVGPSLTADQRELARNLGIHQHIDELEHLETRNLAACYRRASVVLQPSDAEGFGLPVIEAMACGTPVIASDIPALREVGGNAALFCGVANIPDWTSSVLRLLALRGNEWQTIRVRALQQASGFSWSHHADRMAEIYRQVLSS